MFFFLALGRNNSRVCAFATARPQPMQNTTPVFQIALTHLVKLVNHVRGATQQCNLMKSREKKSNLLTKS